VEGTPSGETLPGVEGRRVASPSLGYACAVGRRSEHAPASPHGHDSASFRASPTASTPP